MFSNLNWYNVAVLLLLALFIFGDKLPQMISDGLRMLRNLRRMAQDATSDLNRELGTDIALEDLHPKAFVRKHLLSEADQEALTRPLKDVSDDISRHARGVGDGVREAGESLTGGSSRAPRGKRPGDQGRARSGVEAGAGRSPSGSTDSGARPAPRSGTPAAPPGGYDDIT